MYINKLNLQTTVSKYFRKITTQNTVMMQTSKPFTLYVEKLGGNYTPYLKP
ncbi:hypothetical protein LCGC14_2750030, partial [marine sediment metagenome]